MMDDGISTTTQRDYSDETKGIRCSKCGCAHFYVIDSRPVRGGKIRRRRACRHCGKEKRTIEIEEKLT